MQDEPAKDTISKDAGPISNCNQRVIKPVPAEVVMQIRAGENAVRAIRRHRLLTQRELSQMSGLSENHVSNIENGTRFSIQAAKKLAVALEVLVDDIAQ